MDVKELYAKLDGNYQEALTRLMNEALITRFVLKFKDNNGGEAVIKALESSDIKAIFETAHALKGVAGNLAFTALFDIASRICEKARGKAQDEKIDFTSDLVEFKAIYSKTISALEEFANK